MEIRGAGGDEAALFAHSLYRLYTRYAEVRNWKTEIMSVNETDIGGFKEVIFMIKEKAPIPDSSMNPAFTGCRGCLKPKARPDPHIHGNRRDHAGSG